MVNHYRLDRGTECELWAGGRWVPHTTPRMLFHVAAQDDGDALVFEMPAGRLRVRRSLVRGQAVSAAPFRAVTDVAPPAAADEVALTHELIEAGRSDHGGWSREQAQLLGVGWPLLRGWKRGAVGRRIARADYDRFLALRNAHLK